MKPTLITFVFLFLLNACIIPASANELKIELKVGGQSAGIIVLKIEGDTATAKVADETERFDLKALRWLDPKTAKWTTLAEAKDWAEQSKAKSLKSANATAGNIRPFVVWSLNPTFKVDRTNDTLRLKSGQVDYVIEGQASKKQVEKYFSYAVLNSYKKAMTERKLPPFAELKAIDEMKNLGHIPRKITVTMPGIPNSPKFEMEITETKP